MSTLVVAISIFAIVVLGLAIIIGKVTPADALVRLGAFVLLLCLAPALSGLARASLAIVLKPFLLIVALVVVVTVLVRVLVTMFL